MLGLEQSCRRSNLASLRRQNFLSMPACLRMPLAVCSRMVATSMPGWLCFANSGGNFPNALDQAVVAGMLSNQMQVIAYCHLHGLLVFVLSECMNDLDMEHRIWAFGLDDVWHRVNLP